MARSRWNPNPSYPKGVPYERDATDLAMAQDAQANQARHRADH